MSAEVTLKTFVNTRAPLHTRLPKSKEQSTTAPVAKCGISLSTYTTDFTASRVGNEHLVAAGQTTRTCAVGDEPEHAVAAEDTHAATRHDAPLSVVTPSTGWESEAHASTRGVQPDHCLDFYSTARRIEQRDDDRRGGLVGRVQRAVDIQTKRSCDPVMQPPVPVFTESVRTHLPLIAAQERQLVKKNYLDLVDCTHPDPPTEEQIGFDRPPEERLPGADLSQDFAVQSCVISHMATSRELFRGSAKYVDDKPVGYAGHIPTAECNLTARCGEPDARRVYAKSFMTLAVHGGGVDTAVTATNIRARHRAGKNARPATILKPRSPQVISQTTEGRMLLQPFNETVERERQMNIRDDAQAKHYF